MELGAVNNKRPLPTCREPEPPPLCSDYLFRIPRLCTGTIHPRLKRRRSRYSAAKRVTGSWSGKRPRRRPLLFTGYKQHQPGFRADQGKCKTDKPANRFSTAREPSAETPCNPGALRRQETLSALFTLATGQEARSTTCSTVLPSSASSWSMSLAWWLMTMRSPLFSLAYLRIST